MVSIWSSECGEQRNSTLIPECETNMIKVNTIGQNLIHKHILLSSYNQFVTKYEVQSVSINVFRTLGSTHRASVSHGGRCCWSR